MVNASVRPSPIHGLGCFANEPIAKGQVVWAFDDRVDERIPAESVPGLPRTLQEFLKTYGYTELIDGRKVITICGDHGRYINHSMEPNVSANDPATGNDIAARDIAAGEELTVNYYNFDIEMAARRMDV